MFLLDIQTIDTWPSKLWMEFKGIQPEFISNTIRKYMPGYITLNLPYVSYNNHFFRICIFVKAIIAYIDSFPVAGFLLLLTPLCSLKVHPLLFFKI